MNTGVNSLKHIFVVFFIIVIFQKANANEDSKNRFLNPVFKVDFMSMHIWRGIATSYSPSIEPSLEFTRNNTTSGIWLAHSLNGNYSELDLYFTFNLKSFSFTIYDYYCPKTYKESKEIINYNKVSTNHTIDLELAFNGTQNFPISILLATMIYGDDLNPETNKNNYSTYFQFAYSTKVEKNNMTFVLGFNAFESYYGNQFGVINAGITIDRSIKVFKLKNVPLQASLITNPLANSIFLQFGFTL